MTSNINIQELAVVMNDCSIDRIMAIDKYWCIIAWNNTAEEVTGIKKESILNKKLLEVFPLITSDKDMMASINLAFSGFKNFLPANRLLFNRQHYENHFIPLKNQEGEVIGIMNIMHDVSHRIKAEQELYYLNIALKKKYDQLERATDELATIVYITSNNIKEPLRQVYSAIELLIRAEGKAVSDGGKANLRRIQASLTRMNLLVEDILTLSGINNPPDEGVPVDLNIILQQVLSQLENKLKAGNIQVEATALPMVTGHRDMLNYLFYHLITNAFKSSRTDKPLRISISSSTVITPAQTPDENPLKYTVLYFVDDGVGFEPEDAERIFSITAKATYKLAGSGPGLAICRKIMVAHDGFIRAESWPDKGSAFHCFFPITEE